MDDSFSFLNDRAAEAAPRLLGCILERKIDNEIVRARIVEVEAYDETDAASHSYRGKTARTEIMFGKPGYLYVYFTYGMHYCCNVVVGPIGHGAAVLIRAVEPIEGKGIMAGRRPGRSGAELSNGPAKVCQALAVGKLLNGHDLRLSPLRLLAGSTIPSDQIVQTTRIGISQAKTVRWRFYIKDNLFISKR